MRNKQITVVPDLLFRPEKQAILKSLDCYANSPAYGEMSRIYDRMTEVAEKAFMVRAAYVLDAKPVNLTASALRECNQLIYCVVTIGSALAAQSTAYFQFNRYSEGLVLDAIANFTLFDCAQQLHQRIFSEAQTAGLGLTKRLSPGDGDFDIACQRTILERFAVEAGLGITLTDRGMLDPVKSLAYVYGADANLPINPIDHDCSVCDRSDCKLRKHHNMETIVKLAVADGECRYTISAKTSQSIMAALSEQGVLVHSPCGGRGTCGKCKIKLISGETTQAGLISAGVYLACLTYPLTDCVIDIGLSREISFQTVTDFQTDCFTPNSGFQSVNMALLAADWQTSDSITKIINRKQGKEYSYSLKALRNLSLQKNAAKNEAAQMKLVIYGNQIVDVLPPSTERFFGLAIDIGTTTLVLSLVDLSSGEIVKTYSMLNSQRCFGADVISRIQYSAGENSAALHTSICKDIVDCIRSFDAQTRALLIRVAIAGNTTMLHFLLGLSAESLGRYPFQSVTTESQEFAFSELFGDISLDCPTTILPGVSAFVGADIVAGMLRCGFADNDKIAMLIDIGTNGEIAIGNRDKILCLATAAGPAFEGATISCGTGSVSGAIATFTMDNGQISYTMIDNGEPIGICGSGILDIMAACVRERVVNATGKFDLERFPDGSLPITQTEQGDWIRFTQKDVRELQLAKAAMRAGVEVLLQEYGCSYEEIDSVYLAGSFGSHVNIDSAVAIGLLPKDLQAKVRNVGNSSLGGTVQYLLEQSSQQTIRELLAVSSHLDLAMDSRFNEQFIEQMIFPNAE